MKDLIGFGADCEHRIPNIELNMPLYAILRENTKILDILLESGVSMDYHIHHKPVAPKIKKMSSEIDEVHQKHERWRRLRKWLKLEETIKEKASNPVKDLNHNLQRLLIENYY
mgnify:CR=1 FL=1